MLNTCSEESVDFYSSSLRLPGNITFCKLMCNLL